MTAKVRQAESQEIVPRATHARPPRKGRGKAERQYLQAAIRFHASQRHNQEGRAHAVTPRPTGLGTRIAGAIPGGCIRKRPVHEGLGPISPRNPAAHRT